MNNKKKPKNRAYISFSKVIIIVMILLVWYLICKYGVFSSYILPPPNKVLNSFLKMLSSGELARDIMISFARVVRGFFIAFILAFIFAMMRYFFPRASECYESIIQFFRNIPPISLIPLLILWSGIGENTKTIVIILASFFPIYLNMVKGFTSCDQKLIEVGKIYGYSKSKEFFKIILPSAISDILVGMRIGLGYSWRAIIGAEMIAASSGLGHMILFSQEMSRTDKVIIGIIAIGFIGYLTDVLFGYIIKKSSKDVEINGWN